MMAGGREEKDRTRRVTRYHYRDEYRPDDDEPAREGGVPSSYGEEMGADAGRYGTDYGASASPRSEEHTTELQSLMRISYAVFCLKKQQENEQNPTRNNQEFENT